jgi:hypothetical protein
MKTKYPDWKDLVKRERCKRVPESLAKAEVATEAVVAYAQTILNQLDKTLVEQKQMSYFLRGCDLIAHNIDTNNDWQLFYIRYCKALLCDAGDAVWQEVADLVSKLLLKPEYLNEKCIVQDTKSVLDMGMNVSVSEFVKPMIKIRNLEGLKMVLEKQASVEDVDGIESCAFVLAEETPDILLLLSENVLGEVNILCQGLYR